MIFVRPNPRGNCRYHFAVHHYQLVTACSSQIVTQVRGGKRRACPVNFRRPWRLLRGLVIALGTPPGWPASCLYEIPLKNSPPSSPSNPYHPDALVVHGIAARMAIRPSSSKPGAKKPAAEGERRPPSFPTVNCGCRTFKNPATGCPAVNIQH